LQPQGERSRAALVASITTVGGGAAGPLLAGMLAQYGPWPLMLPFLVSLVLLGLALLGVWAMPEPLAAPAAGAWQIQRPGVPAAIRAPFVLASAAAFVAWAVAALFLAVVPSYLSTLLHLTSLALTGGIASLMLAASATAQLVLRRVPMRSAMAAGSVLLIVGLGGIVLAVPAGSTGLLLLSTLLAGCGQGLAYMGSTVLVTEVAPPEQRGNVLSTYYVMIYLGVGVPVLGVGFGAGWIGLYGAVVAFAGFTGCLGLGVLLAVVLARKQVDTGRHWRSGAA
jgi:MFS family permease